MTGKRRFPSALKIGFSEILSLIFDKSFFTTGFIVISTSLEDFCAFLKKILKIST